MKKLILSLVLALLVFMIKTTSANDKVKYVNEDDPIIIDIYNGYPDKRPRDVDYIPLLCSYGNGELKVEFLKNIGNVRIIVTNLCLGESRIFDEHSLNTILCVPIFEVGDYYLEIVTSTNSWFYGYFTIE